MFCLNKIMGLMFVGIAPFVCSATDYGKGVIFVNENQYGTGNGTLNHLLPDGTDGAWSYRVFRTENPGKELGGTPCDGTYHDGKLYVVSKFAKGSEKSPLGGILTVMDGETLKWIGQIDEIDAAVNGRVCGRSFIGVNKEKGYLSSSDGIWVVDLTNMEIVNRIDGTENPYGRDNKPIGDPSSAIYFGQCGAMVMANGKVFAAHQSKGLLVIDASGDVLVETISLDVVKSGAGIGSVVKGHDGMLWLSVTANVDGDGEMLSCIVKVDPTTLSADVVNLPMGCYPPTSSWAAWTPDTFCASHKSDVLLWTGGSSSWFANQLVFKYDIARGETSCLINFEDDEDIWKVCCPSLRIDPLDDRVYMSMFKDVSSTQYIVRCFDMDGQMVGEYPMERGYWYPGQILFPEAAHAGVDNVTIDKAMEHSLHVKYHNGILTIKRSVEVSGTDLATVYDACGHVVATINAGNDCAVELPLTSGVYLLHVGGDAVKFMVR